MSDLVTIFRFGGVLDDLDWLPEAMARENSFGLLFLLFNADILLLLVVSWSVAIGEASLGRLTGSKSSSSFESKQLLTTS